MTSPTSPERPNLEQLKKQAKDLLRAARARDTAALARLQALPAYSRQTPDQFARATFALHDAQSALAREQGYPSWNDLRDAVEARTLTFETGLEEFLRAATGEAPDRAARLLALHPGIATASFHAALVLGDAAAVSAQLKRQPRLAGQPGGPHSWEPLLYVCHTCLHVRQPARLAGLVAVARDLLAAGANPNRVYPWNWHAEVPRTPLWSALCSMNANALAEALLQGGANPNDGVSIHMVAGGGNLEQLELLRRFGAWPNGIPGGLPPLAYILGWSGKIEGVTWLLDQGADPNLARPDTGERPVHAAAIHHGVPAMAALAARGADLTARRKDGRSPYAIAVLNGNAELASWLESRGAATDLLPIDRFAAACSRGDRAAADALLREHPTLQAELLPEHHLLLHRAAERSDRAPLQVMLEHGFPAHAPDRDRVTPLHRAAGCGLAENVRLLLAHGADVNALDGMFAGSPLVWACEGRKMWKRADGDHVAVARLLLAAGVTPDWDAPAAAPNPEHIFESLAELRLLALAHC